MVLPVIRVEVEADTQDAVRGLDRVENSLDDVSRASSRANTASTRLDRGFNRTTRRSRRMGIAVGQAGFQVADLATQLELGVDPARAFSQQGSQLLGAFGPLGAVLGAVVAVVVPLAAAFGDAGKSAEDLTKVFGTLQPLVLSISRGLAEVGPIVVSFAETIVNNLDRIIITTGVLTALMGGRWIAAFVAARVATFSLSAALVALRGALIRTGIGALIVAAGELIFQFTRLVQATGGFGAAMSTLKDIAAEAFERVVDVVTVAELRISAAAFRIQVAWREALASITGGAADIEDLQFFAGNLTDQANILTENLKRPLESVQAIRDALTGLRDDPISLPSFGGLGGTDADADGSGESRIDSLIQQLETEREAIERFREESLVALNNANATELAAIGGFNEAKLRIEREYQSRLSQLRQKEQSQTLSSYGTLFGNLETVFKQGSGGLLKVSKAFSIAQGLINSYRAFTEVLADPSLIGRPFLRTALAASTLAAGLAQVASIKSVSTDVSGGGAGGGTAGGGAGATAGGGAAGGGDGGAGRTFVNVNLTGEGAIGQDQIRGLIGQINEAIEDGAVLGGVTFSGA